MKTFKSALYLTSTFFLFSSIADANALDYINKLRTEAGLPVMYQNNHLDDAAQNHSIYLERNNVTGHFEQSDKAGYTGQKPTDRVLYAGYSNRMVSENVSYGQGSVTASIDDLMAAIYHIFGFLNAGNDEMGIGKLGSHYVYDMGNSKLSDLCADDNAYSGNGKYYYNVCADKNKKIDADKYDSVVSDKAETPDLVVWPPENGSTVPPAFFGETPDPLPDYQVSGYPVSVQFSQTDDANYYSHVSDVKISLKSAEGKEIKAIKQMDKYNDPNNELNQCQYVLFPESRLDWNSSYNATVEYKYDGETRSRTWTFYTQSVKDSNSLSQRYYSIKNNSNAKLDVVAGKWYAVYIAPNDGNDTLGRSKYIYNASTVSIHRIDPNTVLIKLDGNTGKYATFTFDNGQKLKLVIAENDTAKETVNTKNVDAYNENSAEVTTTTSANSNTANSSNAGNTVIDDSNNSENTNVNDSDASKKISSNSGDSLSIISLLAMIVITIMLGSFFIRNEQAAQIS